jgi:hypothetical protein
LLQKFSGNLDFRPEKFGPTNFRPEFFWIFLTFKPEKTWPEKFHTNFFCDFQLSTGKFSGF